MRASGGGEMWKEASSSYPATAIDCVRFFSVKAHSHLGRDRGPPHLPIVLTHGYPLPPSNAPHSALQKANSSFEPPSRVRHGPAHLHVVLARVEQHPAVVRNRQPLGPRAPVPSFRVRDQRVVPGARVPQPYARVRTGCCPVQAPWDGQYRSNQALVGTLLCLGAAPRDGGGGRGGGDAAACPPPLGGLACIDCICVCVCAEYPPNKIGRCN